MTSLIGISPELSPTAELHLSQLPNVSIRVADSVLTEDHISGKAMLEEIISTAETLILEDARVHFSPNIRHKSVIENDIAGVYKQNAAAVASEAGKYKGIQMRMEGGQFFDIYLDSVQILSSEAIATTLKVFNLITGEELKTQAVTLIEGYNEVDLSLLVKSQNQKLYLAVVTDATYNTQDTDIYGSQSGCKSCGTKKWGNRYIHFYGTQVNEADSKIYSNFTSLSHTNGISVRYSIQCSIEAFVYKFKNLFRQAIWYQAGHLLMKEIVYNTSRVNTIVTVHSGKARELMDEFGAAYAQRMQFCLNNIQPKDDVCFSCNRRVGYKTVTP